MHENYTICRPPPTGNHIKYFSQNKLRLASATAVLSGSVQFFAGVGRSLVDACYADADSHAVESVGTIGRLPGCACFSE